MRISHFIVLLFAVSIICNSVYSQPQKVKDKYQELLKEAKTENERIDVVYFMADWWSGVNVDSAIALATVNLEDARKAGYFDGEYWATKQLATNFVTKGEYAVAKGYLDDLHQLSLQATDSIFISGYYSSMGQFYGIQSMYDSSEVYYLKSIEIDEARTTGYINPAYGNLAIAYQMQSNYPKAIYFQQKALKKAEAEDNNISMATILVNMGNTYLNMGDTLKSEKTFLRAIEIAKQVNMKVGEMYGYSNLAALYYDSKEYDKAYANAMDAVKLAEETGDMSIGAASLSKAALSRMGQSNYKEAETLALRSVSMADSSHQPLTIQQTRGTLANIYVAQEKYREAIPILENILANKSESGVYGMSLAQLYKDLSLSYEKTGQYIEALKFYKIGVAVVDSVRRDENIRKATEIDMTYEFEKEKAADEVIRAKKDAEVKNRQLMLGAGLLIALIIAIGGWISFRNKKRANLLLEHRKTELENTLDKLKNTQDQLIQSEKMAGLGELTAGIAHEIQNPLNFVNNFSELSNELIDELEEERSKSEDEKDDILIAELLDSIRQNLIKINHHGRRADGIVKGMLQHSRKKTGASAPADVNKLSDEYLRLAYHGFRAKDRQFNAKINTDFDPELNELKMVPDDIGRVLLNLLTNSFYAINEKQLKNGENYDPTIWMTTRLADQKICISIKDNGDGIPDHVLNKIFQPFFTTKPAGQGTGLGLSMSYDIIKSHGGDLTVQTESGESTTFTVELPSKN